ASNTGSRLDRKPRAGCNSVTRPPSTVSVVNPSEVTRASYIIDVVNPLPALALIAAWVGTAARPALPRDPAAPDPFVRVAGAELVLDGKPFHFVGANLAVMHGPAQRAGA